MGKRYGNQRLGIGCPGGGGIIASLAIRPQSPVVAHTGKAGKGSMGPRAPAERATDSRSQAASSAPHIPLGSGSSSRFPSGPQTAAPSSSSSEPRGTALRSRQGSLSAALDAARTDADLQLAVEQLVADRFAVTTTASLASWLRTWVTLHTAAFHQHQPDLPPFPLTD